MPTKLIAPRPGEGVEELVISAWLKQEGDTVEEMESIVEVETDKVVTEIPSPVAGTVLKIYFPQGQSVKVGEVMALIGTPGESEAAKPVAEPVKEIEVVQAPAQPVKQEVSTPTVSSNQHLSPLVKRMLEDNQLDAAMIKGTGAEGRITKQDVEAYMAAPKPLPVPAPEPAPMATKTSSVEPVEGDQLIPHLNSRKVIAERMLASVRTSPHVLTVMEADMIKVLAHRAKNKVEYEAKGVNLTLTAYFIAALADGLKKHPKVNASWTEEGLLIHRDVNIGMAVALGEAGLIVPVIKNVQNLSLQGIAQSINDLSTRARNKKLTPDEVKGGTFTLTNHGTGGSIFASPIINQPQLGILGTGMMQKRVVVVSDEHGDSIAIRPMVYLSFVFDHRALDGESADKFLVDVKQVLENWA
ncbi:MAG: dihydrolipoamide acetyltransferase family protein [Anaerolineaceae bacterium]